MLSNVQRLADRLQKRWVQKWHDAFSDRKNGGFYERIGHKFKPLDMGYKRLLTQCRQIAVYADASYNLKEVADCISYMAHKYYEQDKGWIFSITEQGKPKDETRDLYAHAFVIFTLSLYYKATSDHQAKLLAKETLNFIDKKFRTTIGFHEALDKNLKPIIAVRRQNPHMHLFEACLYAYEYFDDPTYLDYCDEIYELFKSNFYIDGTLREFFTDDLKPHPEKGHLVEPGHMFEWVWLIQKYRLARNLPNNHETAQYMRNLLYWANEHGWDDKYGGIYNVLDTRGAIVDSKKRIWPFSEGLKANAMMLDLEDNKTFLKKRTSKMIQVFENKYIDERGFWTEIVERNLKPATDYLPGTTPYHLYFGVIETLRYLEARGPSKSLFAPIKGLLYRSRRDVALALKFFKAKLNKQR